MRVSLVTKAVRAVQRRRVLWGASARPRGAVTIARVLGNDLHPRQAEGQTRRNLDLILREEADLSDKLFLLNRWSDPLAAEDAAESIRAHGHRVHVTAFDPATYRAARCDWRFLGDDPAQASRRLQQMPKPQADRARLWSLRHKLAAAIGINEARNQARDRGGDWTLLLDGACFVPEDSFATLCTDMETAPFAPALILPMHRLSTPDLGKPPPPDWTEEPQVALHRSARLRFDPRLPYGLRDKTALFTALGVPGPWDGWGRDAFLPAPEPTPDRHRYKRARAAVLRLPSGGALEAAGAQRPRHQARMAGIIATILTLDQQQDVPDADLTRDLLAQEPLTE